MTNHKLGWLKMREIDLLTVLEGKKPKSKCQYGHAFSEGSGGRSVPLS